MRGMKHTATMALGSIGPGLPSYVASCFGPPEAAAELQGLGVTAWRLLVAMPLRVRTLLARPDAERREGGGVANAVWLADLLREPRVHEWQYGNVNRLVTNVDRASVAWMLAVHNLAWGGHSNLLTADRYTWHDDPLRTTKFACALLTAEEMGGPCSTDPWLARPPLPLQLVRSDLVGDPFAASAAALGLLIDEGWGASHVAIDASDDDGAGNASSPGIRAKLEHEYRPASWFPKGMSARLRMAAGKTRRTKRVASRVIDGVVCYSVADARRWWPTDVPKGE